MRRSAWLILLVCAVGGIAQSGQMTDVGTPRAETLVVDMLNGRAPNVNQFNPYLPGVVYQGNGYRQFTWEPLWDVDSVEGKQVPLLAASYAEPVDDTFTRFRVKLRENATWSDGAPFTSADVVFTFDMLKNTPDITFSGVFTQVIDTITAVDDHTIEIVTHRPEYRLEQLMGVVVTDTSFKVVPKHIWEKEDPRTFLNQENIATGPYKYLRCDPQGNWFLFERRDDWQNSATGIIAGKPAPKYILMRTYGTEEKLIMAAIQNEIDVLCDISPESWDILRSRNPDAKAWYDGFPWANMDDPAARGIMFNCGKAPFDNPEVRWALLLALDLKNITMSAYSGMLRSCPIAMPPTAGLMQAYHFPMVKWLEEFELADGYKPFDPSFAKEMVALLKREGIEGLPSDEKAMKEVFGIGWWRYDPAQAEKMLVRNGFTKRDGKWHLPDGSPWRFSIVGPSGFEVIAERCAFAIVDNWQRFGLDVVVQPADSSTYASLNQSGNYDTQFLWPTTNVITDATARVRDWHKDLAAPIGVNVTSGYNTGGCTRWTNDRVTALIDELVATPSNDPRVVEIITEIMKEIVREQPFAALIGTTKLVPVTTSYWKGFQTSENHFEGPWWWWSNFRLSPARYQATGK